jgi:PAS domain S-box-containing protein
MTANAYALLGLTAIVAALSAVLTFAVLRTFAAARAAGAGLREHGSAEAAILSSALQEAIAKLKAQERAMALRAEASERLSEEIIVSLTAGLLVVSTAGEVRITNPAARRLLGIEPQGSGAPLDKHTLLDRAAPLAAVIDDCLRSQQPIARRAIQIRAGSGHASHLGVTVSPMRDESTGSVHGAICLFTDITGVVALEEQLRLKDSLARVGELTAGIAHEFRNGLATIHGYARLLDLDSLPPAFRPYVEGIRAETTAMGEVVTNFLNFARPTQLTLAPVDLRAVVERAADDLRPDARVLGGSIELKGEFATVEGDDVLLRQAFSNLLRNAIEACAAASVPPAVSVVSSIDAGDRTCRIVVRDNGPGIPEEARGRIFQPFFTMKPHGTGLGLALVQKIIVTHNGRVAAGPNNGGGCIVVTLPVQSIAHAR